MQATVHRFDAEDHSGSVLLDDGRELPFGSETFASSGLRHARPGQRVTIEVDDGAVVDLRIVGVGPGEPIR